MSNGIKKYRLWSEKKECIKYFNDLPDDYGRAKMSIESKIKKLRQEWFEEERVVRKKAIEEVIRFYEGILGRKGKI